MFEIHMCLTLNSGEQIIKIMTIFDANTRIEAEFKAIQEFEKERPDKDIIYGETMGNLKPNIEVIKENDPRYQLPDTDAAKREQLEENISIYKPVKI